MINIIFGMPGVDCAVVGCGSCRGTKGIGIFKLPSAKDDKHNTVEPRHNEVSRYRKKCSL